MDFTVYLTYFNLLLVASGLLLGILIGFKIFSLKNTLTPEQLKLVEEVKGYAEVVVIELKKQLGDNEELQKEKVVEMISTEFPKIDKKVIELIVNAIFKGTDIVLE